MAMVAVSSSATALLTRSSFGAGKANALQCRSRVECSSAPVVQASAAAPLSFGGSKSIDVQSFSRREWRWHAVAEQLQADTQESAEEAIPADAVAIYFEAEGSLSEASVAKLTSTLEAIEGVSNVVVVATADGSATVKLTKQMSVQATGVASGLVEVLMNGGFKMQALNLGFDEDDGGDEDFYEYDLASSTEEVAEASE